MSQSSTRKLTYYDVLGIQPSASLVQVRQAYREKSKLYHPDTTQLPLSLAREKFEALNQAYAVLNSPILRQQYDLRQESLGGNAETTASGTKAQDKKDSWRVGLGVQGVERPLSAGEIFALFILGLAFLGCLVLAIVVGISRGELMLQAWS
ncbi:J domain-containing protein [Synechococcus sp. PCC 6312]|uniref:J domain-containing protein n=1 Tax=Synechococcus sp. (strain ATCC 27167 / PCC 6312) TaxID=195253 RepID=UPI00029ECB9F|nr:J domain-containing protein [Synechococcus sp. PCC 6312]AFY59772.1 DnaJ-class molecular chaperone [Synechococcus sp. PCC 6312]